MAGAKEIRTKIASIKSTQKITKAMEMVAASKMHPKRRSACAQRVPMRRKYASCDHGHITHRQPRPEPPVPGRARNKKVGGIIVSSVRGLCGWLNINLFRALLRDMQG